MVSIKARLLIPGTIEMPSTVLDEDVRTIAWKMIQDAFPDMVKEARASFSIYYTIHSKRLLHYRLWHEFELKGSVPFIQKKLDQILKAFRNPKVKFDHVSYSGGSTAERKQIAETVRIHA